MNTLYSTRKVDGCFKRKMPIIDKVIAFLIALLSILSANPVVFPSFNSTLIVGFSCLYLFLFFHLLLTGKAYLKVNQSGIFIISIVLAIYMIVPFREYDRFSPASIWFLIFITLLFYNHKVLEKSFNYFIDFIYLICLFSLLILALNSFGVNLPNYVFDRGSDMGGYITSYFVSVKLSGQDYSFLGLNLFRLSGVFAEPGHFGLILAMVLFYKEKILESTKGKIILITCILTMSFGSFVLLFVFFFKSVIVNKVGYLLLISLTVLILAYYFIPNEVLQRFFFSKAEGSLDGRTSRYFGSVYNSFLNQGNILIGGGRDILEEYSTGNSDYRGFILRYGIIGVILYILLMFSMFKQKPFLIQFLGYSYFLIIFLHRAWFIDYLIFLFFLLTLSQSKSKALNNINNCVKK